MTSSFVLQATLRKEEKQEDFDEAGPRKRDLDKSNTDPAPKTDGDKRNWSPVMSSSGSKVMNLADKSEVGKLDMIQINNDKIKKQMKELARCVRQIVKDAENTSETLEKKWKLKLKGQTNKHR